MKLHSLPFYYIFYRTIMRVAHRFHWHYAPPSYPDGDTMLWCHWCGMRDVVKRARPSGNLSFVGSGRVSVPVEDIVKSARVQEQVRAVRRMFDESPSQGDSK
jgi:hypothetical protein